MLIDILERSIEEMKEIYELEKLSNDVQKQEKNDRIYEATVNEGYHVVIEVSKSMEQLYFSVSFELKNKMEMLLEILGDVGTKGMIQETTANHIQKELNGIKKVILQEWLNHYHNIADQKISMLQAVKGIVSEKERVDYASNKIRLGISWEFRQDNLDKMANGLKEADDIIENLGLGAIGGEIIEFLKKVVSGKASINDLTPTILGWMIDKNMTSKFAISFKSDL